MNKVCH